MTLDFASLASLVAESDTPISQHRTRKYADNPFAPHVARSRETGKALQLTVPGVAVKDVVNHLRAAARDGGHGLRLHVPVGHPVDDSPVTVRFQAKEARKSNGAAKVECPECGREVSVTADGKFRVHGPRDERCPGSDDQVDE